MDRPAVDPVENHFVNEHFPRAMFGGKARGGWDQVDSIAKSRDVIYRAADAPLPLALHSRIAVELLTIFLSPPFSRSGGCQIFIRVTNG